MYLPPGDRQNAFANPNSQEEAISTWFLVIPVLLFMKISNLIPHPIVAYEVMIGDLEKLERLLVDNQMDHRTLTADADVEKIRGEISELFNEKNKLMDCIRSCSQKLSH